MKHKLYFQSFEQNKRSRICFTLWILSQWFDECARQWYFWFQLCTYHFSWDYLLCLKTCKYCKKKEVSELRWLPVKERTYFHLLRGFKNQRRRLEISNFVQYRGLGKSRKNQSTPLIEMNIYWLIKILTVIKYQNYGIILNVAHLTVSKRVRGFGTFFHKQLYLLILISQQYTTLKLHFSIVIYLLMAFAPYQYIFSFNSTRRFL